jgi:hypothetical protein
LKTYAKEEELQAILKIFIFWNNKAQKFQKDFISFFSEVELKQEILHPKIKKNQMKI